MSLHLPLNLLFFPEKWAPENNDFVLLIVNQSPQLFKSRHFALV